MTGDPAHARKPYDPAPYASLRTDGGAPGRADPAATAKDAPASDFLSEGERLRALREALWSAFETGPEAGLPNTLIDLTMAYTNALRLQLDLRAVAVRQPKARASLQRDHAAKR